MDKIHLNNMGFYGYHGVLKEETTLGQKFFIDIELYVNLKEAGISDNIDKSVSYAEVYNTVKKIAEGKPFKLLEGFAESLSTTILKEYGLVDGLNIKIRKPEAPVPGIYDFFGVEITRYRND